MLRTIFCGVLVLAGVGAARADHDRPYIGTCGLDEPHAADYEWMGQSEARRVTFPSRQSNAHLCGTLFWPADDAAFPGARPAVVLLPPTAGGDDSEWWAARDLAGHGYIVLIAVPQGQSNSDQLGWPPIVIREDGTIETPGFPGVINVPNFVDAGRSGIDYLLSNANPERERVDPERIAIAGYSQGAIAASVVQDVDPRVKAAIGWDNLASTPGGDSGSPRCPGDLENQRERNAPRVPAMGQASDGDCEGGPDEKKTAWSWWRENGVPAMQLVLLGRGHGAWGTRSDETDYQILTHYSRAWLDLWLLGEPTALERLKTREVFDQNPLDFLSTSHRSGFYVPASANGGEEIDCPDLRACLAGEMPWEGNE